MHYTIKEQPEISSQSSDLRPWEYLVSIKMVLGPIYLFRICDVNNEQQSGAHLKCQIFHNYGE